VEPPDRRNVQAGQQLLEELGAIRGERLTKVGQRLARLPIDPRLGRMILEADRLGCLREVLVLTAALSVQDPRERPVEQQARADQLHARFRDKTSDFLTWLNLWRHLREEQRDRGSSSFRRMCREEFLNYLRVREWQDYERQLRQVAKEIGLRPGRASDEPDADGIHQALLSGLLSHIGLRDPQRRDYLGARGARFAIFPGSGLFRSQPAFVMAAELVETSRLWGRQVAAVDPAWAERLGANLVKRSYSEPHWSRKRESAMAYERVTLYGVPLVADRLTGLGRVQPELARELFIRHALVYGEWRARHRFFETNRQLLEEAEELEHRARRRDIVVDEHTLFDFYDARIPPSVVSGAHFDSWWKQERREHPDLLTFDPAMLVHEGAAAVTATDFPDEWREGAAELPVSYTFEPGAVDDGVTIDVPVATLNTVGAAPFSWNVPGLREELVTALIRSLPKQLRVNFVPAPNVARAFLAAVPPGEEPLPVALARYLRAQTGVHVPDEAWSFEKIPAHLRPTFRIVDDTGAEVARGKDLEALKDPLRPSFEKAMASAASDVTVTGQTSWTFGTIEPSFTRTRAGHEVHGFPALVDEGSSVGLRVFGSEDEQRARHRLGVRRLLLLVVPPPDLLAGLDNAAKLGLAGSPYPTVAELLDDCVLAAAGELVDQRPVVLDEAAFVPLADTARRELAERARGVLAQVLRVLADWREVDRSLSGRVDMAALASVSDMQGCLSRLVHRGFIASAGAALRAYPRYLSALRIRRERLDAEPRRDAELMARIDPLQQAWQHRIDALPPGRPPGEDLVRVRWLLEEYRVSLWAQQLGTAQPVSDARIRKLLT
jgi:ATP-dependent helicase HrpA